MTVAGNLAFQSGAHLSGADQSRDLVICQRHGHRDARRRDRQRGFASGSYISKQYTILTAGSVSGTFGSVVNTNLPANFTRTLSYDAKDAYLNLALNFTPPSDRASAAA